MNSNLDFKSLSLILDVSSLPNARFQLVTDSSFTLKGHRKLEAYLKLLPTVKTS